MVVQAWCRAREAERLYPFLQTQSRRTDTEVRRLCELSKPDCRWRTAPTTLHLTLISINISSSWGPSLQTPEPVGDILIQATTDAYNKKVCVCGGTVLS